MPDSHKRIAALLRDRADLKRYVTLARAALAELAPGTLRQERVGQAKLQIAAVLTSTEAAAETIMRAAEDGLAGKGDAADHFIQIIEACSFQDLTGQRISKVLATLEAVDAKLSSLETALGENFGEGPEGDGEDLESLYLQGPPLPGAGLSQRDVDALLKRS